MKPYDYFGNLVIGGGIHNGNISVLCYWKVVDVQMTIFSWITLVALLLAVMIANTDKYAKAQFWMAAVLYVLLTGLTVYWWIGG